MRLLMVLALILMAGVRGGAQEAPIQTPGRGAVSATKDLSDYHKFQVGTNWTYSVRAEVEGLDEVIAEPDVTATVAKFKDGVTHFENGMVLFLKDEFVVVGRVNPFTPEGEAEELVPLAKILKVNMNKGDQWQAYFPIVVGNGPNLTTTFEDFDSVTVPAGTFNAVRLKVALDNDNYIMYWYAPKIGLVKTVRFDVTKDHPKVKTTRVLEKYEIK